MKRIGIVNRGEPAVRFLDALAELGHERADAPEAVALYVTADARSLYVRRAPHAVCIGEGRAAFLDAENVLAGLRAGGCDAAWLGWGFASEDAPFAATLEAAGITLLAPRAETMAALGDKIRAKQVAEAHGVPVAPWAIVEDAAQARVEAERIGFPLLVKAAGGGGGRGIRPVDGPDQLAGALVSARDEALRSFGSGALLLERLVTGARHVEVQVLGDGEGGILTLGVRDCSLQRRRQKVIEECPSPALPPAVAAELEAASARLCGALRYRSAGTVEFLYAPADGLACFLEVNTRLQVEHPITEAVHGVDLVRAQILLALGEPLPALPGPRGHAIEARVTAEDPRNGFAPAPGRLERVVWPSGPGVRVDAGFAEGELLSPDFDPMVAKIIAHGPTRAVALGRLARALEQTTLVVQGGQTNLDFLRSLIDRPEVQDGTADTGLLDRLQPDAPPGAAAAVAMAAIDRFVAAGDQAGAGADRHRVDVGQELWVYRTGEHCFRLVSTEGALTARCWPEGRTGVQLELDGRVHRVERAPGDVTYVVDGVAHRVQAAARGVVVAPSMAVVLALPHPVGAVVAAGETVALLESMKMEVRVDAATAGRVVALRVRPGDQVQPGQPLVMVEPEDAALAPASGPALPWSREPPPPERAAIRLTTAVIGWDIEPGRFESDLERLDGPGCLKLLNTFADIAELFEGRSRSESWRGKAEVMTPRLLLDTLRRRGPDALSPRQRTRLRRALVHHGIEDLAPSERLADALTRIQRAGANRASTIRAAVAALQAAEAVPRPLLDRLAALDPARFGPVCEAASRVRYEQHERPAYDRLTRQADLDAEALLADLRAGAPDWAAVARAPLSVLDGLAPHAAEGFEPAAEAVARRLEGDGPVFRFAAAGLPAFRIGQAHEAAIVCTTRPDLILCIIEQLRSEPSFRRLTLVVAGGGSLDALVAELDLGGRQPWRELCLVVPGRPLAVRRLDPEGRPRPRLADVLPVEERRFNLERLADFDVRRLPADEEVLLLLAEARDNPDDRRLLAYGEVRSLQAQRGRRLQLPHVDRVFHAAVRAIEAARAAHDPRRTVLWNRLTLVIGPVVPWGVEVIRRYITPLAPAGEQIGLEKVVVRARFADAGVAEGVGPLTDISIHSGQAHRLEITANDASTALLRPRTVYESRVVAARRLGLAHPYEIIGLLERGGRLWPGRFEEWDLDAAGAATPVVGRAPGQNQAAVVFGLIHSTRQAETLTRVLILSDPTVRMGALAEAECRRVLAALELADRHGVPVEWVAVSSGARIDWHSGTENLDWTARVLARIVRFTRAGGEINLIVAGVCVGAQSYWNAEATMMMHCRGLLIMTDAGSMVLTGKRALDASGCVSAEDELALGGYAAIMGPNGQAQAHATDIATALRLLYRYYAATYVGPGRRRAVHAPPRHDRDDRDVGAWPYPTDLDHGFATVGQVFSDAHNPGRKRPFAVRPVMDALIDRGQKPLERWSGWREAEVAVVYEARIGGYAATLIGIDNQPMERLHAPVGGPASFSGGTLYPQSSRKVARAINAASGRRPVVVLANLSGFDGSPESLAKWQLEYGAEIGQAVVGFDGCLVFVVLSRYHGGAYVVFSKALNAGLRVAALEGSFASVIGGVPAATVVFGREVKQRLAQRGGGEAERPAVIAEVAREYDAVHTIERARRVGSVDDILALRDLRPYVIARLAADHAQSVTGA